MENTPAPKKFELTSFNNYVIGDKETSELLLIGLETPEFEDFLSMNRDLYGGIEIFDSFHYYALVTFIEDGQYFTLLNPYLVSYGKYPKRNFAFGAYSKKLNKLYSFFDGKATTNDRKTAMLVYNSLVAYCQTEYPEYTPFAIKM